MKIIFKGILYYTISMSLIFGVVYISGFYIELSANAYFDIFRSYSVVYAAILIFDHAKKVSKKKPLQSTDSNQANKAVDTHKIDKLITAAANIRRFFHWLIGGENIFEEVCKIFTIVTLISSTLMVLQIDVPKVGSFAYIHLLIRLFIILTTIVAIEVFIEQKNIFTDIKNNIKKLGSIKSETKADLRISIAKYIVTNKHNIICEFFTMFSLTVCVLTIILFPASKGGAGLYQQLLAALGLITVIVLLIQIPIKKIVRGCSS